jgi:arylsulfatase A-like enzyme
MNAVNASAARASAESRRPNIVLIMTDNQGPWTLGCYGNPDIRTPNLDRMAAEGVRFTRAFSNNAVCSPTRATYLTGLMPCQHGVHKFIDKDVMLGPHAYSTLKEFDTLPQILHDAGYVCGLSGKWHLGANLRPQEGFSFWVTKPYGHTTSFRGQKVIENGEMHTLEEHQTDYWTRRGVEFIEANRDRPFFLFLAYNGPYGLGDKLVRETKNRYTEYYADKELPSFPRTKAKPWNYNYGHLIGDIQAIRGYASEVSMVDDGVGEVLAALERLGLQNNTLVVFTADQGLAGGHGGYWGMGDHTRPLTAHEGTMRVPLIFRHPGAMPAGLTPNQMVSNYDFMRSALQYLRLEEHIPAEPESPGRSYHEILRGAPVKDWDNVVFYEFENVRAIRTERWKCVVRVGGDPNELYDLENDPDEDANLYDDPAHQAVRSRLRRQLHAFFEHYADPKWDLWNGGDAKGGLLLGKKPYAGLA